MSNILSKDNKEVKTKKHQCSFCYGKGKKTCRNCKGTGKVGETKCSKCKGTGSISCTYCSGEGQLPGW